MYILSNLQGTCIQKSNVNITDEELQEIKNRFENELGIEVIGTSDEVLYNKANETGCFDITIENNTIIDIIPKEKTVDLEGVKLEKITQTKQQLSEFLENHLLLYNGEYYSVTQEKQALLTSAIAAYQLKVQTNVPAILKWNTTGDVCREFTIEDITGLVIAITDYVQPRVEKQQVLEVQIKNCPNIEELDNIVIDYEVI